MGDNGDKVSQETVEKLKEPIKLLITLLPDGRVNVAGPIKDRLLCYGLLETAKEAVADLRFAKKIEVPNQHGILNFARNFKR